MTPYQKEGVKSLLESLALEWEQKKAVFNEIVSIYIGGGTPSLLSSSELKELLSFLPKCAGEITLEVNPNDVTLEKMLSFKESGVNRVSIGVQSFDDETLKTIGRTHNAQKAIDAIHTTYQAGITNISIDLMYDLPKQTLESWQKSIDIAVTLPITHLSLYNLTFEEGSSYFKHKKTLLPLIPEEPDSLSMLQRAVETFTSHGFTRYEISAFCREGKVSQHNLGYWIGRPFLGLGPSAFSYIEGRRFQNIPHFKKWHSSVISGEDPVSFTETLPHPQNLLELLAVRLRLSEGADLDDFPPLPSETMVALEELVDKNLLIQKDSSLRLSPQGTLFYDTVASAII